MSLCCSLLGYLFFYGGLALIALKLYVKLTTGWCRSQVCLVGKTTLVTGANTGIGYETALDFAKRGARVILACRNEQKAKQAVERIIKETDNPNVVYRLVDFSSLKSVRQFAEEINRTEDRLDILVNNAGAAGMENKLTEDGLLIGMQVNYFGPFLLTILLLDLLKKSGRSRIVNVSSKAANRGRSSFKLEDLSTYYPALMKVYSHTKVCNVLFTIALASKLKDSEVTTYSLHPGLIETDFFNNFPPVLKKTLVSLLMIYAKSPRAGAQTTIHCSIAKGIEPHSGEFFNECAPTDSFKAIEDRAFAKQLWKKTEEMLKIDS